MQLKRVSNSQGLTRKEHFRDMKIDDMILTNVRDMRATSREAKSTIDWHGSMEVPTYLCTYLPT